MSVVHSYRRVRVENGKHGIGDYRVTLNGSAPSHGEFLTMLWWIFEAEDRYNRGYGRRLLWWHIVRAYYRDATLNDIQIDADGKRTLA